MHDQLERDLSTRKPWNAFMFETGMSESQTSYGRAGQAKAREPKRGREWRFVLHKIAQ